MDRTAAAFPAYRALLVVDMKNFSGEPGRDHAELTDSIPEILRQAFQRCGLADLWEEALFAGSTGDGYFLGFSSRSLPCLINPFLSALQDELDYRNKISTRTIRMRVSINVGPMTGSGENAISDGSGEARIETHRLLDSEPVRALLDRSGPATCVAAIVSARAFEDAILPGYSDENPDLYVPAPAQVKTYQGTAYLRVPHPSGDLLRKGFRLEEDADPESAAQQTAPEHPGDISGSGGRTATYGTRITSTGDGAIHYGGAHHGDIHQTHKNRRRQ